MVTYTKTIAPGYYSMKNLPFIVILGISLTSSGISYANSPAKQNAYLDLFDEVVRIIEQNFYNPEQSARAFPAIKETYRKQLAGVSTPAAYSTIVNSMLRELNASHTFYLTPDDYEYFHLAALFSKIPEIKTMFGERDVIYVLYINFMHHRYSRML